MTFNPYVPRPIDRPTSVPLGTDADLSVLDEAKIFAAPSDPADWPRWREVLRRWRQEAAARVDYDDALYSRADFSAIPTKFVICLAWLWDELLYDHDAADFTVERFLRHAREEFGGYDGVVLWHAYPVIGIDDRNQFDFYRQVEQLPEVVRQFHREGVDVYINYNPWDVGTRREDVDDIAAIARTVEWLRADGVFLDTMKSGGEGMRRALDAVGPGVALEGESRLPLASVHDHPMSWAQWFADTPVPGVLRTKWLEPRHMLHHTRRWNRDHSDELHSAWLNGVGMLVWESVFGVWVGWNARDRELLRVMRRFWDDKAAWFYEGEWTPLADYPGDDAPVFASRWERDGQPIWTLINRSDEEYDGAWIEVDDAEDAVWTDLVTGAELEPVTAGDGRVRVGGRLPARGITAVQRSRTPLHLPARTPQYPPARYPVRATVRKPVPHAPQESAPQAMAEIAPGAYELTVTYRQRETALYGEVPYVDEWKPLPPRLHDMRQAIRPVTLTPVAIASREVTNAQFADFLAASGYRPRRAERFLAHWVDGRPCPGTEEEPVAFVDLADARAFAAWYGRRLPTEDEWQVAGESGVLERGEPLVWNWTESEHSDGRTRFSILKGGCAWRAEGSDWYIDGGYQPPGVSVKFLFPGAGLARSASIGFRCAVDIAKRP